MAKIDTPPPKKHDLTWYAAECPICDRTTWLTDTQHGAFEDLRTHLDEDHSAQIEVLSWWREQDQ